MVKSNVQDTVRFGRVVAARYWLGIEREDDAVLYQTMSWWRKALFWWGVSQALRVVYPRIDVLAAISAGCMLLLGVVFGWGPF